MSTHTLTQAEPRRWAMFVILLVGAFLPPLDFFIVNVALPAIQGELGASSSAEQLVISSYAAVYAVTLITGGRLGDIYGRGKMFFIGLIGFAAASLLCGLAWSPWVLITGRMLQGATAAIMAPQALASVQAIFPEAEKPLALSIYGAVFGLASVIGQVLGGILISADLFHLGWRTIFLVNLPVALLVILFGLPLLKETRAQSAQRLDPIGMLLATVTLSMLIVPLTDGPGGRGCHFLLSRCWPRCYGVTNIALVRMAVLHCLIRPYSARPGWDRDWRSFCCSIPLAPSFFCFLFIYKGRCI